MKKYLLLCLLLSFSGLFAQPKSNSAKPQVEKAIGAMGGLDRLRGIKSARVEYRSHLFWLEESERPDGPFIVSYQHVTELRDYEHNALEQTSENWGLGSFDGRKTSLTVADGVAQANIGDKHRPMSMDQVMTAQETLSFSADRTLLAALDSPDLHPLPDVRLHDETYHVVAFTRDGIPVKLYLNGYTGLPAVIEWTRAYPYSIFWRQWGDVHNRLEFTNYFLLPGGYRVPFQSDLSRNGQAYRSQTIAKIDFNPAVTADSFVIAPEVKTAFEQRKALMADAPPLGKPSPLVEGDDSLVQFVGAWNCAIVKQPDGLVIIEAPVSPGHTRALLAEAHKRYPNTAIKAVITTSDSWPHFGGIREVVANNLPIYATDLNQPILTRFINAPFTQVPDTLAKSPKPAKFHWISGKTVIGTGSNRLELYPMRNASGERMMMVYFPGHKLLYTSDLVQPGQEGPFFMMEYVREAADAAKRENLAVDRFFGMHMPMEPWSEVEKALAATESGTTAKSEGNSFQGIDSAHICRGRQMWVFYLEWLFFVSSCLSSQHSRFVNHLVIFEPA